MNSIDYDIKAMKMLIDEMKETIENQRKEIQDANDSIIWWTNRYKTLQKENKRLNCIIEKLKENKQ